MHLLDKVVFCADPSFVDVVKECLQTLGHLVSASCVYYYYIRVITKWQGFLGIHALEEVDGFVYAKVIELTDEDYIAWVQRCVFCAFFEVFDIQSSAVVAAAKWKVFAVFYLHFDIEPGCFILKEHIHTYGL